MIDIDKIKGKSSLYNLPFPLFLSFIAFACPFTLPSSLLEANSISLAHFVSKGKIEIKKIKSGLGFFTINTFNIAPKLASKKSKII